MKITKKVSDLLNEQFYNELYAAHIYFAISASMRLTPYQGVAKWMRMQAKEEMEHAEKIYEYLVERGAQFKTSDIRKPETAQIEKICDAAEEDKDRVTCDFLAWFLKEQVEEENNTFQFVRALEFAGDDKKLVMGVDSWAGKRAE